MRWKAFVILSKYYLKVWRRNVFGYAPLVLFVVSGGLSLFALSPALFGHPQDFEVTGRVVERIKQRSGIALTQPLEGVTVEVGGFRTVANSDGVYDLHFRAQAVKDIPVIFDWQGRGMIDRISFPPSTIQITEDYTFNATR